jgi:hypothetical protein
MKKLIQIALVLILITGLFQFVGAEPIASTLGSSAVISADFGGDSSVEDTQMASCLVLSKRVICVVPNVGWNT